jgi:hypothetical protein
MICVLVPQGDHLGWLIALRPNPSGSRSRHRTVACRDSPGERRSGAKQRPPRAQINPAAPRAWNSDKAHPAVGATVPGAVVLTPCVFGASRGIIQLVHLSNCQRRGLLDGLLSRACNCRKQLRRVKLIVDQYRLCLSDFDYQYSRGPKNSRLLCVG